MSMTMTALQDVTLRDCAKAIIDAVDQYGDDDAAILEAVKGPMAALTNRDDLASLGVPRQGNNVSDSQYLYFDGQLAIILFEAPKGKIIPPHDHGVWEGFCVYRGSVHHKLYRRADDGSVDGYAELETIDDKVMSAGDVVIVAPPDDIHGFSAMEEGTLGITFLHGAYKPERLYFQPDNNSYVVRTPSSPR